MRKRFFPFKKHSRRSAFGGEVADMKTVRRLNASIREHEAAESAKADEMLEKSFEEIS